MAAAVGVAAGLIASLATASPLSAQDDVELLGRIHGTTPPPGYYEVKARNPGAFRFSRAWMGRNPALERMAPQVPGGPPRFRVRGGAMGAAAGGTGAPAAPFSVGAQAVTGTIHFPLILGEFSDGPSAKYTPDKVQTEFFDGPTSSYGTIEQYYAEISNGRIDLQGETFPWVETGLTRAEVVGSTQGLAGDAQVGLFIVGVLAELDDGTVDWGRYDNDGPDGVPNSGDDDGFVDILAVMHPTWGGECGGAGSGSRIWSHKWQVSESVGEPYVTRTPSSSGGFIRVDDYAIQPVERCGGGEINQIGVLAHELGHGFGLPDLYAVGGQHQGIGEWGLMGSGSWGCQGARPHRPCHMSAWSKSILGWVDVVTLDAGEDHGVLTFPSVGGTGVVYRMEAGDGSGEYFLLENRQPTGFDAHLHAPGLLVWHVDPALVAARWPSNTVNSTPSHMGVWLRQADGRDDLAAAGGGRGDAGDPFPGTTGNTVFHAGSNPDSRTHGGASAGLTLLDVDPSGGVVHLRILTRYQTVAVSVEGGAEAATLLVDGVEAPATGYTFPSAPFEEHLIGVQGGEPVAEGVRHGFVEWVDDPEQPRERTWVTGLDDAALVARFGGLETRLRVDVSGGAFGVDPGVVGMSPTVPVEGDGWWFPQGTMVGLEALPNNGFGFAEWTGAAAGQGNPAVVDMSDPADVGLAFEMTYEVPESATAELVAGRSQSVVLQAENGTAPVTWHLDDGAPPEGMEFRPEGRIVGVPLEEGSFTVQLRAVDGRGLEAAGVVVLEVAAPPLATADLTGPLLLQPHGLTPSQIEYLDFSGNRNGAYDLGDFRAYFLAHPDLPEAVSARDRAGTVVGGPAGGTVSGPAGGAVARRSSGAGPGTTGADPITLRVVRFRAVGGS